MSLVLLACCLSVCSFFSDAVSRLTPREFEETYVRVFAKEYYQQNLLTAIFQEWKADFQLKCPGSDSTIVTGVGTAAQQFKKVTQQQEAPLKRARLGENASLV